MAHFLPHAVMLGLCAIAFTLWHFDAYPFTDPVFAYEGYALHFFGGVAYVTAQVLFMRALNALTKSLPSFIAFIKVPRVPYRVHVALAFYGLLIIELLQFFDPSRHVQWQDVLAQTAGIIFATMTMWLFAPKRTTP